jgi:hypothetical protein
MLENECGETHEELIVVEPNNFIVTDLYNDNFARKLKKLNDIIIKYGLILSGSMVISVILGENFKNADFDIYTTNKFKMRNENEVDSLLDDELVATFGGVFMPASQYRNFGKNNYKYICPDFTINIINVNVGCKFEIYDYILKTSDIDICASTYDGKYARFPNSLLERNAKSINKSLINEFNFLRRQDFISKREWKLEIKRLKEVFIKKRKTRIIKYMQRNIVIDTDLKISEYDIFQANMHMLKQESNENFIRISLKWFINFVDNTIKSNNRHVLIFDGITPLTIRIQKSDLLIYHDNEAVINSQPLNFETLKWGRMWI